jgi:putative SOS response-associated peptidase YedK
VCYSAQIEADYMKLLRSFGPIMSLKEFAELWLRDNGKERRRIPKAIVDEVGPLLPPEVQANFTAGAAADEQDWQQELFKQARRVADNERKLATKYTKTAEKEVGIGQRKVEQLKGWIQDLHRDKLEPRDWRFFPQWWAPVLVREGDGYAIKPMRYQLRKPGLPASSDWVGTGATRRMSGTYNARRDNLERYWRNQFGRKHGLIVASRFYENVDGPDGKSHRLEFTPRTGEPMLVACLWDHWADPAGQEPDMLCFAAVTDEPEPEVLAAGHDRTVINLKWENVEGWLNPDPGNLAALYDIFDDKRHPFYEHKVAA